MKELSIEQKARRYDEILARAEGANLPYYKEDIMSKVKEFVDYLIPELKESEDENADEKVRKALIKLVTNYASMDLFIEYDIHLDEALSWLEKQRDKDKLIKELGEYKVKYTQEVLSQHLEKQGEKNLDNSAKNCKDEQKPKEKTKIYGSMDDLIADALIEEIEGSELDDRGKYNRIHWIESHRQKHAWNEEDIKMFVNIKACLRNANKDYSREVDWLKSIKPQPKNEWSEEDERILLRLIAHFDWHGDTRFTKEDCQEATNWLKSLRPQKQWKPTEEQMEALDYYANSLCTYCDRQDVLRSLYNDLKKL